MSYDQACKDMIVSRCQKEKEAEYPISPHDCQSSSCVLEVLQVEKNIRGKQGNGVHMRF
jgi:hypothetical protein